MSEEKNGLGGRPPVYTKWLTEKNLKKITAWSAKGLTNHIITNMPIYETFDELIKDELVITNVIEKLVNETEE